MAKKRKDKDEGQPVRMNAGEAMQYLASNIDFFLNGEVKPQKNGFVLLVFPFQGDPGERTNYVGNCNRAETVMALREIVARFEARYIDGEATTQ